MGNLLLLNPGLPRNAEGQDPMIPDAMGLYLVCSGILIAGIMLMLLPGPGL